MSRSRFWCFTLNNYVQSDIDMLADVECTYLVYGKEVGKQGTPHLQGYIEFEKAKSITAMKRDWGARYHFELRKGRPDQASQYCKKDKDFVERGEISKQFAGKRNDLVKVFSAIKRCRNFVQAYTEEPQVFRYPTAYKMAKQIHDRDEAPRWRDVHVTVYYGVPGVGKSRRALDEAGDDFYILPHAPPEGMVWFDNYERNRVLIIDDFDGWISHKQLLRILDGHPLPCPVKGSFTYAYWTKVIITSNTHPKAWYVSGYKALERRINRVELMEFVEENKHDD